MSARVKRLPGDGCVFYKLGRCLYEERLNPGWNKDFRCVLMVRWEEAFDLTVRQADTFSLEEEEAGRLWARRFTSLARGRHGCQDFVCDRSGTLPGCVYYDESNCVLKMPPCQGRCTRYERPKTDRGSEGEDG